MAQLPSRDLRRPLLASIIAFASFFVVMLTRSVALPAMRLESLMRRQVLDLATQNIRTLVPKVVALIVHLLGGVSLWKDTFVVFINVFLPLPLLLLKVQELLVSII